MIIDEEGFQLNSDFSFVLDKEEIFLFYFDKVRKITKESFELFLSELLLKYKALIRVPDYKADDYMDAYEWISINLHRVAGIQLYSDGEIRLNLDRSKMVSKGTCMFLSEAPMKHHDFDNVLYEELLQFIG